MLTPPRHFAISACPTTTAPSIPSSSSSSPASLGPAILYRGSIPETRNITFIRRLKVKTILVLSQKEPQDVEVVDVGGDASAAQRGSGSSSRQKDGGPERGRQSGGNDRGRSRKRLTPMGWMKKRDGVDVRWIKVDKMGKEKLGTGKTEVGEVLKLVLDTSLYPLYIADADGRSHTSLIIACLRKLQGWHMDSIIRELERFEPEYDEYPFQTFLSSYLTGSSSEPLSLPPPPYPSWLWPSVPIPSPTYTAPPSHVSAPAPPSAQSVQKAASASVTPSAASPASGITPLSRPGAATNQAAGSASAPASAAPSRAGTIRDESDRDGNRDKATLGSLMLTSATAGANAIAQATGLSSASSHSREQSGASSGTAHSVDGADARQSAGVASRQGDVPAPSGGTASMHSPPPSHTSSSSASSVTALTAHSSAQAASSSGKGRDRERTASSTSSSTHTLSSEGILPFPHPQQARRHPTMKLTFPPQPPAPVHTQEKGLSGMSPLSRTNSRWEERDRDRRERDRDRDREATRSDRGKEREKEKEIKDKEREAGRERGKEGNDSARGSTVGSAPATGKPSPATSTASHSPTMAASTSPSNDPINVHGNSLLAAATSIVTSSLETLNRVISPSRDPHVSGPSSSSEDHVGVFASGSTGEQDKYDGVAPSNPSRDEGAIASAVPNVPAPRAADPDATPRLPRSVSFKRQSSFSAPSSPGRRAGVLADPLPLDGRSSGGAGQILGSRSHGRMEEESPDERTGGTLDLSASPTLAASRSHSIDTEDGSIKRYDSPERNETEQADGGARSSEEEPGAEDDLDLDDYSDEYDEDEDEDEEDEEEEEEEEDEDVAPTALHISALDLAGYG